MQGTVEDGCKQGQQQKSWSSNIKEWMDMTTDHPGGSCQFLLPLSPAPNFQLRHQETDDDDDDDE